MGATIARGEITIVDLIDTATYIYYSKNADGTNATSAPTSETKYIGIYSGPSLASRPSTPPQGTVWSKYVGEDGQQGEKGEDGTSVTITSTSVRYAKSSNGTNQPTSGWQSTIPSLTEGEYLWTRTIVNYSDGKTTTSYSVSHYGLNGKDGEDGKDGADGKDGKDGEDANTYYIETNQEEILRFKTSSDDTFSPESFSFDIYENPKQLNSQQLELNDDSYTLEILTNSGFKIISGSFLRLGYDIINKDTGETEIQYPNTVFFDVPSFLSFTFTGEDSIDITKTISEKLEYIFRFSYIQNNKILALKIVQLRLGLSEELAKFNAYAGGINASIQSNKLAFDATGLTLYENNEKVFWSEGGNLWLKGNLQAAGGTFTGELKAATGSFSGSITATSGKIGGLTISDNVIYSGSSLDNSALKIYGSGDIEAENITLGNGTVIKNYIKLGDENNTVFIRTPTENNDTFLESGNISLKSKGYLKIGKIELYGGDGEYGTAYLTSGNEAASFWKIKDDGTANFRELTVDKITVQNSVMEIGKIQAVGGVMFFKDSWKVASVTGSTCNLDLTLRDSNNELLPPPLEVGDYVLNGNSNYYQVIEIKNSNEIVFDRACTFSKGDIITKIGKQDDYLITIQGNSDQNLSYSTPNSLTISSILVKEDASSSKEDIPGYEKKLVLGDLTGINSKYGTGLYAENVFLNGTLTTKTGEQNYAGVNTLTGANATKFDYYLINLEESEYQKNYYYIINNQGEYVLSTEEYKQDQKYYFKDTSKIVFWAGSTGIDNINIQKAKFQVSEAGSIYASQGVFEGSLITDSIIKGASIHTAKIYGEGETGAALKIYDASRGIQFINSESSEEVQLGINNDGLYTSEKNIFIDLKEGIKYFGQEATYLDETSIIFIKPEFIGFGSNDSTVPAWKIKNESGFVFTNDENSIFEIKNDLIKSSQRANFEQGVVFGKNDSSGTLDYQKTAEGFYNLYVR